MSSPHPSQPPPPQPTLHIPQFPLAGQPDMIRSVQKDEYYTQVLFDYLKEVSIWLIGMRNVMRFERELHTISRLLYYILTMFPISFPSSFSSSSSSRDRNHGQQHRPYQYRQTLGEEYCDLVQFISHHQPSKPQSSQSASQQKPTMAARHNSFISLSTFSHRSLFIILHVLVPHFWHMKSVQSWFNRQLNQLLSLVPFSHHQNKKKLNGDNKQQQRQSDSDDTAAQKLMIDFSKLVPLVLQLHLAIFYMSGQYLSLSKRFARIRYMFTGSPGQVERPTYRILGLLIFIQLFVSLWMYVSRLRREKRLKQLIRDHDDENDDTDGNNGDNCELLGEGDHRENQRGRRGRGRTVSKRVIEHEILNDESWHSNNGSNTSSSASGGADSQMNRCSLCLDKRRQTTATACGHLFCWSCIAECCTNATVSSTGSSSSGGGSVSKCPICRQDISLQTLTRVYHFDHSDVR